ncbi:hypothetical protein ACLOJK_002952 [Asimina triloba]
MMVIHSVMYNRYDKIITPYLKPDKLLLLISVTRLKPFKLKSFDVVVHRQLKEEERRCLVELQCNIVAMRRSHPKVLRLNLGASHEPDPPLPCLLQSDDDDYDKPIENRLKHSTPISSPEDPRPHSQRKVLESTSGRNVGASTFYVCEENPLFDGFHRGESSFKEDSIDSEDAVTAFGSECEVPSPSFPPPPLGRGYSETSTISAKHFEENPSSNSAHEHKVYWIPQNHAEEELKNTIAKTIRSDINTKPSSAKTLLERFAEFDNDAAIHHHLSIVQSPQKEYVINSNVRDVISLGRTSPSIPPPLCSICQHKVPVFGKPPRSFRYEELEEATDRFSDANFLAEGGFGPVHRGVLADGQVVAVKQLKLASSQGDAEFCSEVEVLSCAQHRNVVMLIGFCLEGKRRVLVYEYVCNGSLDVHLYGKLFTLSVSFINDCKTVTSSSGGLINKNPIEVIISSNSTMQAKMPYTVYAGQKKMPLNWHSRLKIAVGAARGLRYLHEDCRVGCIVHRDMRPNNILVTHDFEPLVLSPTSSNSVQQYPHAHPMVMVFEVASVGDFGLARWNPNSDLDVETRVIGTLGYLAPEYAESGRITEKADIYAFGVVLLELITGQKAIDMSRPEGQQFLVEWARPLLESEEVQTIVFDQLLDPQLDFYQLQLVSHQVLATVHAAALCLRRNPLDRPNMSKVLRIIEGDAMADPGFNIDPLSSRSGRMNFLNLQHHASYRSSNRTKTSNLLRHASCNVDTFGSRSERMNSLTLQQLGGFSIDSVGSRSERINSLSLRQLTGSDIDSVGSRSGRLNNSNLLFHSGTAADSAGSRSGRMKGLNFLNSETRINHSNRVSLEALKAIYTERESNRRGIY